MNAEQHWKNTRTVWGFAECAESRMTFFAGCKYILDAWARDPSAEAMLRVIGEIQEFGLNAVDAKEAAE